MYFFTLNWMVDYEWMKKKINQLYNQNKQFAGDFQPSSNHLTWPQFHTLTYIPIYLTNQINRFAAVQSIPPATNNMWRLGATSRWSKRCLFRQFCNKNNQQIYNMAFLEDTIIIIVSQVFTLHTMTFTFFNIYIYFRIADVFLCWRLVVLRQSPFPQLRSA